MGTVEQQIQQLIETREDFVVLLNASGVIIHSSQGWVDYCDQHRLPEKQWKVHENYIDGLTVDQRFNVMQSVQEILSGSVAERSELLPIRFADSADHFSIKYQPFLIGPGEHGVILYKHPILQFPVDSSNEVVLKSMTDAFYMLDEQMNFCYLNSKASSFFGIAKDELIGSNIWEVFPHLAGTTFHENCIHLMQKRTSLQFEEYYSALNTWFTVKVTATKSGGLGVYFQETAKHHGIRLDHQECANTDYLTGWPNRRKFEVQLEQILEKKTAFSLLYINLDNFKHINTLYNHKIGDQIFKKIAANLEKLLSPQETAGRLDGDELILLHLHKKTAGIRDFSRSVRKIFEQAIPLDNTQAITVNASIGVSSYPEHSSSAEELIIFAENAMREAKKQPHSSYSYFHSGMKMDLVRRLVIEKSLSENLTASGFHFALQPQINCVSGELAGVEVLSRWDHPKLGPISPFEFINIAEETGTISHLTHHLLNEVFSFIHNNIIRYGHFPKTAINVTPSLLTSPRFFEDLFFLMNKYNIPPELIEIEITECIELTFSEMTLQNLLACKAKGISIALDDFGTGFSTLAYLMEFPIDKIKLDKSFISKIGHDPKSEAVLKSLIKFINSIDCRMVAEGVELASEAVFLEESGCLVHQGYLYDKPLPPENFIRKYLLNYNDTTAKNRLNPFKQTTLTWFA